MKYVINGGNKLYGSLPIYPSKNCMLSLLAASILAEGRVRLSSCRQIADVANMIAILRSCGAEVTFDGDGVSVNAKNICGIVPQEYGGKLRGSLFLLGALLGKTGRVEMPMPGGCAIGSRPIDIHVDGLRRFGVSVETEGGKIICDGRFRHAANYALRFPSVGATENLLTCAVSTKGVSELFGCAVEPEVVSLENFLVAMGAKIEGVGTPNLKITGTNSLHGVDFVPIPDRIVASTYLIACAGTGGKVTAEGCPAEHLGVLPQLLQNCGCDVEIGQDFVTVTSSGKVSSLGQIETAPWPGFPTDVQSLVLSLACIADGETEITENLFENRLLHNAAQLQKMGAKVTVEGNKATVTGGKLHGAIVSGNDLRGGAGLVLAGLFAEGRTEVYGVSHVQRGYFDLVGQLRLLGADVALTD